MLRIYERTPDAALVYDPKAKIKVLLIRDEGKISRVQVSRQITTLAQAIDWLRPRDVPADAERQGDLYFVEDFDDKHFDLRGLLADATYAVERYGSADAYRAHIESKMQEARERVLAKFAERIRRAEEAYEREQDPDRKIDLLHRVGEIQAEAHYQAEDEAAWEAYGYGEYGYAWENTSTDGGSEYRINARYSAGAQIAQTRHYAEHLVIVEKAGDVAFVGRRRVKTHSFEARPRLFVKGRISHEGHHEDLVLGDWHEVRANKVSSLEVPSWD